MAEKRIDGRMCAIIGGCALAGIALVALVGICFTDTVSALVDGHGDAIRRREQALFEEYSNALVSYSQSLEQSVQDDEIIIGVQGTDDSMFMDSLEAAGVDSSRVHLNDDGIYVYRIEHGDTLTSLSAAFDYSVDALANYNDIEDVNRIYAESSLRIPEN